ncbi:hypothetical protein U1Q18_031642 [Sarracenia purpurea var. burkii]
MLASAVCPIAIVSAHHRTANSSNLAFASGRRDELFRSGLRLCSPPSFSQSPPSLLTTAPRTLQIWPSPQVPAMNSSDLAFASARRCRLPLPDRGRRLADLQIFETENEYSGF